MNRNAKGQFNSLSLDNLKERFWSCVSVGDDCWEWSKAILNGYGVFSFKQGVASIRAHRYAYESWFNTTIEKGVLVCHKCDNPRCCRPDHLFLGSNRDNMRDLYVTKQKPCKVSLAQADEIRDLSKQGLSNQQIAEKFNVSRRYIWAIIRNHKRTTNNERV